ncbi:hypothetical protein [Bartonella birtlesii]|uniref:Uncharacterized protein n=1 Tax=Bartonella birtlesii LL-WM9 TaxID=1094552 RepID=J0YPW0_9HYPH|nr:hypothetical protein [Bartonella birtlesii]EJF76753.1 hypothetical protein ME7_00785 [Bartonella birtlesii LL-WM9]
MEKRIRARQKAYFKRLYRKIAFVFMLLFCLLAFCFLVVKIISHFSSHKKIAQKASVELIIPVFDHRVYCKEIAASVTFDRKKEVYQHCLNLESEAYFAIREMWDTLSEGAKKKCIAMVRPGDGNYFLLRDCFFNEKDSEKGKARNRF